MNDPNHPTSPWTPAGAVRELRDKIQRTSSERIRLDQATGRILTTSLTADRDSPAADVSAMDGYALRMQDLATPGSLDVCGESRPGHAPPSDSSQGIVRIFTGAIVPSGFDCVIRREETKESATSITLLDSARRAKHGDNIRRRAENISSGEVVLEAGTLLNAAAIAAAANFGASQIEVQKQVRVSVIVTGDELQPVGQSVTPWQLRDSNGPTLQAMLIRRPDVHLHPVQRVIDSLPNIQTKLNQALAISDVVVFTGGVSMGDYDHVPAAVLACGGELVFHRVPLRPGKPILAAVTKQGQLILGLPGNPVSAAVGARRFLLPLLACFQGAVERHPPAITLVDPPSKTLPLWWLRLVKIDSQGNANIVPGKGSGDLVALAASDGFIEQPPEASGPGPWTYWEW